MRSLERTTDAKKVLDGWFAAESLEEKALEMAESRLGKGGIVGEGNAALKEAERMDRLHGT
jgi:hypothetical protein